MFIVNHAIYWKIDARVGVKKHFRYFHKQYPDSWSGRIRDWISNSVP